MKNQKRPWQRLLLSLFGVAIIAGMWRWATFHLYALPIAALPFFSSLTNNAMYVIGSIVIFMVTGRLIYDWKNQTTTSVVQQAEQSFQKIEHTEVRSDPKHFDDPSIP